MQFIHYALTGKDNTTYDVGRILIVLGSIAFLVFEAWAVFHNNAFDMQAFGIGYGSVLLAGGGHLWMKRETEPDGTEETIEKVDH
ncbi:MAG: amino acid ABC transporter substrate-binding protein [Alphaproteobacteria bacterium]|nr:amino acid ABC transporter substrate-binding protein [Alphaproteobacteria bacterium]